MDCNISGHNRAVSHLLDPECYAPSDAALDPINPVVFGPGCTLESLRRLLRIEVPVLPP